MSHCARIVLVASFFLPTTTGFAQDVGAGSQSLLPSSSAAAPSQVQGIFRVWTPTDAAEQDAPLPLTALARERARAYRPLQDNPALRCIPPGMPSMLETLHPVEFVDRGDRIVMRLEEWNAERAIHMNPRNSPPIQEPSPYGVSFGRWEGETLAVFTLYIDYPYFDGLGTPQSDAVTVLERYTPSADGTRLDWFFRVTDEATFAVPVVREGFMTYRYGATMEAHRCTPAVDPNGGAVQ